MAELKRLFVAGMMDKDRDERLVKNGTYRDALNIHISSSEASDAGAVENLLGNKKLSTLGLRNAKAIGVVNYTLKNKIYWIIASDNIDGIYEYDQIQKTISPILIDTKSVGKTLLYGVTVQSNDDNELVLDNIVSNELKVLCGALPVNENDEVLVNNNISLYSQDPYIKINIPQNTILRKENNKYVFKNIEYNGQEYGNIAISFSYSLKSVLNFSKDNLITGINIIDDMLFWTDNLNPPRKINIPKFKKYTTTAYPNTDGIFLTQTLVQYSEKDANGNKVNYTREFSEDDLSVAKKAPINAPTLELKNSLLENVIEIERTIKFYKNSDLGADAGEIEIGVGEDITISGLTTLPNWKEGDSLEISSFTEDSNEDYLEMSGVVKQILDNSVVITITNRNYKPDSINYLVNISLLEKKPIHELSFIRFAYRWKYKDGEYSTMSPFSETAFIPKKYEYNAKEGLNLGMENDLRKVILSNFDLGDDTVDEIEILYKETRNQNIYTLKSSKRIDFKPTYEITKEKIHSVLPNDQLLRSWDNVPKKAKAQTVTANRIIYGNYTQNYDIYNEPEFNVFISKRQNSDYKRTIKSDRTYQFGVVYIDDYNRHSPVLSDQTGVYSISGLESSFQNQFNITLKNNPPAWAKYFKYYIKDNASEYYNIAADRFYYDDDNGFMYVSFSSNEVNKIAKDQFIILKKEHGTDNPVREEDNRYKVIDLFNEAPDFIANRKKVISALSDVVFTNEYTAPSGGIQIDNKIDAESNDNSAPIPNYSTIQIKKSNGGADPDNTDNNGIPSALGAEIKSGRYIQFEYDGKKSDFYEIDSVGIHSPGSLEIKIDIKKEFGDDVNIIYKKDGSIGDSGVGDGTSGVKLNILEEYSDYKNEEFDGRFFVKLKANSLIKSIYEENQVNGKDYSILEKLTLFGKETFSNSKKDGRTYPKRKVDGNPLYPLFLNTKQKNTEYAFSVEELNTKVDDKYLDLFTHGAKFYFSNDPESIYEIERVEKDYSIVEVLARGNRFEEKNKLYNKKVYLIDQNGERVKASDLKYAIPTYGNNSSVDILFLKEKNNKVGFSSNPAIFETEPIESKTDLDIYYETKTAFPITEHGNVQKLEWYNAFCFGNGVESNRIRDDFNAPFIGNGVKASSVIAEQVKEEHKFNGLIWSGIINSKNSVNKANEFNQANPITKDLLPSYGSIQKLHAWDDQIVMLCEDKIVRAYADKDVLYNADGNPNVVATNRVIGSVQPYNGEYGISQNPESFAAYGFRCYFTDKMRGAVIRLSKDGLEVISRYLMTNFFKERFFDTGCYNSSFDNTNIIGSYDNYNDLYNISFNGRDTVCFDETATGWVTRKSFVPENAISLNNTYYTFLDGELWEHDSKDALYNNFYGIQYNSEIELEINDDPSAIKKYKTIGYEGTKGWKATIITDQEKSSELGFKEKENKYFAYIKGDQKNTDTLDLKSFNFQGLGEAKAISGINEAANTELTFELEPAETEKYSSKKAKVIQKAGTALNETIEIKITPKAGYILNADNFKAKGITASQNSDGVILNYTHGLHYQPTVNKNVLVSLCKINFASKKTITVSGTYSREKNRYLTFSNTNGTFSVSGAPNVLKIINTRTITPVEGFILLPENITSTNPNIILDKKQNLDGSITVDEKIIIPSSSASDINYTIIAQETEKQKTKKELLSASIDTSDAINGNLNRILSIYGDPGAQFSYKFENLLVGTLDEKFDLTIPSNGIYKIEVVIPINTPSIYTITLQPVNDTKNGSGFTNIIQIPYSAKGIKEISLFSQFESTTSNTNTFKVFANDELSYEFTQVISLPPANYILLFQPKSSDFVFDNNIDTTILSDLRLELDNLTNEVTLYGSIKISGVTSDNQIVLFLDKYINEEVTLSIDYSNTILGGFATANYTHTPINPYTITGPANIAGDYEDYYEFEIIPDPGYEFITNISSNSFTITDSTTEVIETYALDDKLKVSLINNAIIVRLTPKDFKLPSASTTIYIRPTENITQTLAPPVGDYSLSYIPLDNDDRLFTNKLILGKLTYLSNQNFLFQKKFIIDRSSSDYAKVFSTTGHTVNLLDNEISLATAGQYTDINGTPVTVTDYIEINSKKTELTLNILANISSVQDKKLGRVEFDFATEESYTTIKLAQGDCKTDEPFLSYRLFNIDPSETIPKIGAKVTKLESSEIGITDGSPILENIYKIEGQDVILTLTKKNVNDIDTIKNIGPCINYIQPIITADNIVSTYGNGAINIGAVINNNYSILRYSLIDGSGQLNSKGVFKAGNGSTPSAGSYKVKIHAEATASPDGKTVYEYAEKIITITVKKADPTIQTIDISLTQNDIDDVSIYVSSNAPGAFSYTNANTNIMSLIGTTLTATGFGSGKINGSQEESLNYNSGSFVINVSIEEYIAPVIDTDGDGVPDDQDIFPNLDNNNEFSLGELEEMGLTNYVRKSNGELKYINQGGGTGYVAVKTGNLFEYEKNEFTYKARLVEDDDGDWAKYGYWITLLNTTGIVSDSHDDATAVLVGGTPLKFKVENWTNPDSSRREVYIWVDAYYKGKLVWESTSGVRIKQYATNTTASPNVVVDIVPAEVNEVVTPSSSPSPTYISFTASHKVISKSYAEVIPLSDIDITYWHDGNNTLPIVGDFIYTNSEGSKKANFGYYRLNSTTGMTVNSVGKVIEIFTITQETIQDTTPIENTYSIGCSDINYSATVIRYTTTPEYWRLNIVLDPPDESKVRIKERYVTSIFIGAPSNTTIMTKTKFEVIDANAFNFGEEFICSKFADSLPSMSYLTQTQAEDLASALGSDYNRTITTTTTTTITEENSSGGIITFDPQPTYTDIDYSKPPSIIDWKENPASASTKQNYNIGAAYSQSSGTKLKNAIKIVGSYPYLTYWNGSERANIDYQSRSYALGLDNYQSFGANNYISTKNPSKIAVISTAEFPNNGSEFVKNSYINIRLSSKDYTELFVPPFNNNTNLPSLNSKFISYEYTGNDNTFVRFVEMTLKTDNGGYIIDAYLRQFPKIIYPGNFASGQQIGAPYQSIFYPGGYIENIEPPYGS